MALANFTLGGVGVPTPTYATTSATPLRVDLDDLLYSPVEHQPDAPPVPQHGNNEPFAPPTNQQKRPKVRKRAGMSYLPPANQYTQYQEHGQQNPYQLHTQLYQMNTRLKVHVEDLPESGAKTKYDNTGQYVHDPSGDYDYEQKDMQFTGGPNLRPRYLDTPYGPATTPTSASSRRYEGNPNQNVNNYNFNVPQSTLAPPRQPVPAVETHESGNTLVPPDKPRGFTKVETGHPGGKTQLHAVLDYDSDYGDELELDGVQPSVTPLQGPILLRNGSVPVVPLTAYRTVNNGSYYQIPILWTALSVALGYEIQGQIIRGVPCVKRNFQLYCPTAGTSYPLDKIENFIDENKALVKRMYGSFTTPLGNRVRRAPGVPDMHDASGDSYFRHVRQTSNVPLPDPQSVNSTGRVDACESKTEIMTPYWALNSARKLRAIVNTMHFEQAIHQETCRKVDNIRAFCIGGFNLIDLEPKIDPSGVQLERPMSSSGLLQAIDDDNIHKKSTSRCAVDCGCEQKYKWHRLLAYDPNDDCAGIFMDWFLFPSCCVCRCKP